MKESAKDSFSSDLFGEDPQKAAEPSKKTSSARAGRAKIKAAGGSVRGAAEAGAAENTAQAAAEVSVLVPLPQTEAYTYAVADTLPLPAPAGSLRGHFVRVPVGGRMLAGIITSDAPQNIPVKKLRFVEKFFDCPPLSSDFLDFIHFMAEWTMTPTGMIIRMVLSCPAALEPLDGLAALRWTGKQPQKQTAARARIMALLQKQNIWTRSGLAHAAGCAGGVIDVLRRQGLFAPGFLPPDLAVPLPQADYAPPKLTDSQAEAASVLTQAVRERRFRTVLLEGVTGSGKTEVYFEAVAEALRQGRQVLLLLPEIALTQQVLTRFAQRFGAEPAAWHSSLSQTKRERIWRQAAEGRVRIVAGARSALFLPFRELGLIIVDEEHDSAYKQEERVVYHARDMAVARGRSADVPVILSSATPSVESCVNVLHKRYGYIALPARFGSAALPDITVIDMRRNQPPQGRFLSLPLLGAIESGLRKGEQSLLFLNRRGYAPLTLCRVCGHRFSCPDCSAWLVEHRARKQLCCHHCGFSRPLPQACPECGTFDHLTPIGPGVERIAEEVRALLPQARLMVLSADTGQSIAHLRAELAAIIQGDVDIVIGTQLVAKGHHFPKMTCVGVIDADIGLSNGDLRAAERSFQLLSQVTGRAGREIAGSRGFIQTYQPEHMAITALAAGNGKAFIRREIEERAAYHLPPFGQLAALIISDADRAAAESHARALRAACPKAEHISVLGPAEAPLARLRGRYRFRLLAQADTRSVSLQAFLRALLAAAPKPKSSVRVQIDIDPQSFL